LNRGNCDRFRDWCTRTSATLMPSAEVPLITPATIIAQALPQR
jgi:hypothetical protein